MITFGMPFIGLDWRAPGDKWVKTPEGWEKKKLKLVPGHCTFHSAGLSDAIDVYRAPEWRYSASTLSSGISCDGCDGAARGTAAATTLERQPPHYFLTLNKSPQFIRGVCLSDAIQKLDFCSAISDVRRFNYVSKVVEILVKKKLVNLSGSGRKILLSLMERLTEHCLRNYLQLYTLRSLITDLTDGLNKGHHYGSGKLLAIHQNVVRHLVSVVCEVSLNTEHVNANCSCSCVQLLDLPVECLLAVLSRLSDHDSLINIADTHYSLRELVEVQCALWRSLCRFHFTKQQIAWALGRCCKSPNSPKTVPWRAVYFECKRFFGLKEFYADMIHICRQCKALFWKSLGHPCISETEPPSVSLLPCQFVDLLV